MVLSLATATLMALGASGASAQVAHPGNPAKAAISDCTALVDGTASTRNAPGHVDPVLQASRSCAIACGVLSDLPQVRGRGPKVDLTNALNACAAACDFIIFEGAVDPAAKTSRARGPIATAVQACQLLAASNPSDTAGLPLIDNGGRSWR